MNLATAVAEHLDQLGLVDYQPSGAGGDVFIDVLPSTPDEAVSLRVYGGGEPDPVHPYDRPRLQAWVRGTRDPRTAQDRSHAIYDALHGLSSIELPGGLWAVSCFAQAQPAFVSVDENQRVRYSTNFLWEVRNPTANREGW